MSTTSYTAPTNNPSNKPVTYHCAHHRLEATSTIFANDPTAKPNTVPASSCDPDSQLPHNLAMGTSPHIPVDSTVSTPSYSYCHTA